MKRRNVTEEELALWRQAMRNTTPLPGRGVDSGSGDAGAEPSASAVPSRPTAPPGETASAAVPKADADAGPKTVPRPLPGGLDAATRRRLRRGRTEIEGRVDLHGMRRAEAHLVLTRFIAESQLSGRRCVLVITGKGGRPFPDGEAAFMRRDGDGVLRREVPRWLAQEPNASRVFAIEQAHPRHGGAGALYVFLRKARGPT
ncbi:MAG: Smr/MutS family protein [Alphaproteobacteria bacterium]